MALPPASVRRELGEEAERWGGELAEVDGALRLTLPVIAGLRRGWVSGTLALDPSPTDGGSTEIGFVVDQSDYIVDRATVVFLAFAAFGALTTLLAPFFPRLVPLLPAGIFLALGGWLFVVARLRNSGPEEFFDALRAAAEPLPSDAPGVASP
ncbi:MAG: hypothetical protein AAGN46_15345 [Acidobacteriota bacterium]